MKTRGARRGVKGTVPILAQQKWDCPLRANRHRRLSVEPLEDRHLLSAAGQEPAIQLFNTSPALFVENRGQWSDDSVRYAFYGSGANVLLTDSGPVFQVFSRVGETHQENGPLELQPHGLGAKPDGRAPEPNDAGGAFPAPYATSRIPFLRQLDVYRRAY